MDSVETLNDFSVYLDNGTEKEISSDGVGFCMCDQTDPLLRAIIRFDDSLGSDEVHEAADVYMVLHELAHANTCQTYLVQDHVNTSTRRIEASVTCQVAAWAFRDPSGYEHSEDVAELAIIQLADDVDWLEA